MSARSTIPVHILTGFLGSGKTTLLNRALTSSSGFGADTAIVVNEFGDVALDQMFIQERSEETIVLKSGCICCSIRTDLVSTLTQLAAMSDARERPLKRVVIETSGISDPAPILATLGSDFRLLTRFHVGAIVCVVDATDHESTRAEAVAQLAAADACIVTKLDLAEGQAEGSVEQRIHRLNPGAAVIPATRLASWIESRDTPNRDIADILASLKPQVAAFSPGHSVRSLVLRIASPTSWPRFAIWLSTLIFAHGDKILRMKGLLYDQARDTWLAVHGVRRFLHPPEHLQSPRASTRDASLVFIVDGLDPVLIERSYRQWVLTGPDSAARPLAEIEAAYLVPESTAMALAINEGVAR
jgi:G3E family GTPase